jgi:hypothetical protein
MEQAAKEKEYQFVSLDQIVEVLQKVRNSQKTKKFKGGGEYCLFLERKLKNTKGGVLPLFGKKIEKCKGGWREYCSFFKYLFIHRLRYRNLKRTIRQP